MSSLAAIFPLDREARKPVRGFAVRDIVPLPQDHVEELYRITDNLLVRLPNQHQQNQSVAKSPVPSTEPAVPQRNGLLDVREAAKCLKMSPKWLYRNYRTLPHVLIPAGRKPRIRFKREALERWIHTHSFNQSNLPECV